MTRTGVALRAGAALGLVAAAPTLVAGSLQALADRSDAVVVGTVTAGTWSATGAAFDLQIERVLKGTIRQGSVLSVVWNSRTVRISSPVTISGERGLFFLAAPVPSSWILVPVEEGHVPFAGTYYPLPKSPATPGARTLQPNAGAPVADSIAAELAAAVDQCGKDGIFELAAEGLLRLDETPFLAQTRDFLATSACEPARGLALVMRLKRAEPGALAEAAAHVDTLVKSPYLVSKAGRIVFGWNGASSGDVQALGCLATSQAKIGRLKKDAAHALMRIHSHGAVPFLAELLDSPDEEVRRLAIRGLSLFVEGAPPITPDGAQTMVYLDARSGTRYSNEHTRRFSASRKMPGPELAEYVKFWKTWWSSVKKDFAR